MLKEYAVLFVKVEGPRNGGKTERISNRGIFTILCHTTLKKLKTGIEKKVSHKKQFAFKSFSALWFQSQIVHEGILKY